MRKPVGLPVAPAALLTLNFSLFRPETKPAAALKLVQAVKLPAGAVSCVELRKTETMLLSFA